MLITSGEDQGRTRLRCCRGRQFQGVQQFQEVQQFQGGQQFRRGQQHRVRLRRDRGSNVVLGGGNAAPVGVLVEVTVGFGGADLSLADRPDCVPSGYVGVDDSSLHISGVGAL
ncbi:unnamed protein product [Leptidea sinapis]|uniref:Uncharacterized protein n=1 Tax=Leptidea sinapis TaxID=189913 RepID=A0A5E4Q2J6_9NEOP|nr:unnamed protein product [Leptidea sinapis]